MSDYKDRYSNNSKKYINDIVPNSIIDQKKYNNSKIKESLYNEKWLQNKVNINEVVNKFAPNGNSYINGYKYIYDGVVYQVVTDMVAGYLRIKNKRTNQYVKMDGKPGSNNDTHFKILKREEM